MNIYERWRITCQKKKIIVMGGDGFCGWPTSLHLSRNKMDVTIIDNLSRRNIDNELGTCSLTPVATIEERLAKWKSISGDTIQHFNIDIAQEYTRLAELIERIQPDTIVHFAEQRAAPYSMMGSKQKRYTVNNNVNATHNILCAIVEKDLDIHLVHLGTMGVYGYNSEGFSISEGYIDVDVVQEGKRSSTRSILHPMYPGSVYHTTKCLDEVMFYFYNKNDQIRITDLHQGIVWGTNTKETHLDPILINRFDYDGMYGTVLNRFLMQSALGYPLTIYGTGGQTRAFIHIENTIECIRLAIENPPDGDRVRIFNQATETHSVEELARFVSNLTGAKIEYLENPRREPVCNDLNVIADSLQELGLHPICLQGVLCEEEVSIARKYKHQCDVSKILNSPPWRKSPVQEIPSKTRFFPQKRTHKNRCNK